MKELPILNVHDNLKTKLHRLSNGILSRLILIKNMLVKCLNSTRGFQIGLVWFMVLNTTFNNMSVILWRSVSLVKETGVPGENRPRWCM
jgi:hypothetical protein